MELTEEERAFLERNADKVAGTSLDLSDTGSDEGEGEVDPLLEEFKKRNPDMDLSGTSAGPNVSPVAGRAAVDITDQVKAGQESERDHTYGGLYGDEPSTGILTTVGAAAGDLSNALGAEGRNEFQVERDQVREEQTNWADEAQRIYDSTGYINDDGQRVYEQFVGGNKKILIPEPGSTTAGRVIWQAGRDLYQELGGLVTEGSISGENEFAESRPDFELSGGEELLKDIIAIGVPTGVAMKGAKYAERGVRAARGMDRAADAGRAGVAASATGQIGSGALAEAVMSGPDDDGLLFDPQKISDLTNGLIDGDAAKDTAMILDGMVVNGAMDGLLKLATLGAGKGRKLVDGVRQMGDRSVLRAAVEEGTLLNVVKILDPEIDQLPQRQFVQRLGVLSRLMEEESILKVTVGETSKDVNADSITAMMNGAENYIRETHQHRKNSMSPAEYEEMVQQKAGDMTSRMIGLVRSQQGSSAVQQAQTRISNEVGDVFGEEARRIAEGDVAQTAQDAAENLVRMNDRETITRTDNLEEVDRAIRGVDERASRVVQDNPVVQDLVADVEGGLTYSDEGVQRKLRTMVDDGLMTEFKRTADEVDALYKAIPNEPIDPSILKDALENVVKPLNDIDGDGARKARNLLGDIFEGFEPRAKNSRTSPLSDPRDPDARVEYESIDEVLERVGTDVGFQDMYKIKANLSQIISRMPETDEARGRLIEFRNSITSEDGLLGEILTGSNPEAAEAALRADRAYKDMQSRFSNEDTVARQSERMRQARIGEGTVYSTPQGRNRPNVSTGAANDLAPNVAADKSGKVAENLRLALGDTVTDAEFNSTFAAQSVEEARRELARALRRGDTQTANQIEEAFERVRPQLQKFGETDLLEQADEAVNSVRKAEQELGDERLALDTVRETEQRRLRETESSIVRELVSKVTPGAVRSDAPDFFSELILSGDSGNRIRAVMDEAEKLPGPQRDRAVAAIQASALENLGDRVFGSTPVGMRGGKKTTQNVKMGELNRLTRQEANNLQNGLREAFGADSDVAKQVADTLGQIYDSSVGSRMQLSQAGSDTAANLDVRDAVSTTILLSLGYMNPTAAAARRLTASAVKGAEDEAKRVSKEVLEAVSTNPREFSRLLDAVRRKEDQTVIRRAAGQVFPAIGAATGRAARYNVRVEEGEDDNGIDAQMKEIMGLE